jgi:hypothetical protein
MKLFHQTKQIEMKHPLFTLLFALGFVQLANAQFQSAFEVHPNPIDTMTTADEYDSPAKGKISNISEIPINLRWVRTIVYHSPNITSAVCDPVTCWSSSVDTKDFTLDVDSSGQMTVHFYNAFYTPPPGQAGSGIVHVKITNLNNPADTLNVVYSFSTLTGTGELPTANVRLFPNPTTDFFTLENGEEVASMRLYALDGREMARFMNNSDNTYSIANLPVGNYVLSFEDKNGNLFQAVEIHKR